MKIALDYTTGIYPGAGVARYTRSLVASLDAPVRRRHAREVALMERSLSC